MLGLGFGFQASRFRVQGGGVRGIDIPFWVPTGLIGQSSFTSEINSNMRPLREFPGPSSLYILKP